MNAEKAASSNRPDSTAATAAVVKRHPDTNKQIKTTLLSGLQNQCEGIPDAYLVTI